MKKDIHFITVPLWVLITAFAMAWPSAAADLLPLDPAKTPEVESIQISASSAGIAPIGEGEMAISLTKDGLLRLEGPYSFAIRNGLVEMSVGAVSNHRPVGSLSGTLELWLFANTFRPVSGQNNPGYTLAKWRPFNWHGEQGNQLKGGYRSSDIELQNLTYLRPPPNCYHISIFLMEWNGSQFVYQDFATFSDVFGLGGGSCGGPPNAPSGLTATPTSSSTIDLFWNDNSSNEDEFQVQISTAGGPFEDLGSVAANSIGATATGLLPNTFYTFRVRSFSFSDGASSYSATAGATTFSAQGCHPNATTLCLSNDRYAVRVAYTTESGDVGQGFGTELTADTGYYWFFSETNVEVAVKVIDACNLNEKIWVFAGGLTNLGIDIQVQDTVTGNTWTGSSPLGRSFQTITDSFALPCD